MKQKIIFRIFSFLFISTTAAYALECPKTPELNNRSWMADVSAAVAKVLSVRGGDIKVSASN